ncbi:hypothetical protein PALU110988_13905 [Paenibacillus lupini]|jgi:hypothetical protein|uniref:hypothetical protein n=1 Tax=Paenibacillus lupini TaxID=1450204 RepID=UPI0014236E74|nr:hypothetical protein [Paenibacillus lupini]NIK24494.1 hypothetical protein [Paenibacillus lupini]
MNNETTNEEIKGSQEEEAKQFAELVNAVQHNGFVALRQHFEDVQGQVLNQELYGPVFVYKVKDESGSDYVCGFFLRELIANFQAGNEEATEWMASFFYELMKVEGGKPLPQPPASEDDAKALIDKVLIPHCIKAVEEEFPEEKVHAGLAWNEELKGPVFETGFPAISDGNNVCAFSLHLLYTHLLINRDPAELLLKGLYKIRTEHGMD